MYKDDAKTVIIPGKEILRFQCCDCGLVHDIKFETVENSPITVIMTKNAGSTGQLRRYRQIKMVYGD